MVLTLTYKVALPTFVQFKKNFEVASSTQLYDFIVKLSKINWNLEIRGIKWKCGINDVKTSSGKSKKQRTRSMIRAELHIFKYCFIFVFKLKLSLWLRTFHFKQGYYTHSLSHPPTCHRLELLELLYLQLKYLKCVIEAF